MSTRHPFIHLEESQQQRRPRLSRQLLVIALGAVASAAAILAVGLFVELAWVLQHQEPPGALQCASHQIAQLAR